MFSSAADGFGLAQALSPAEKNMSLTAEELAGLQGEVQIGVRRRAGLSEKRKMPDLAGGKE